MVCIYCGKQTRVTNSRPQRRQASIWRRRLCAGCGAIFTTLERVDYSTSFGFKNDTSHIIPFDRDTLFVSLLEACKHRPNAIQDATALTDTVIAKLLAHSQARGLIARNELVATAAAALRRFDHTACTYYLAYHRP